MPEDLDYALMLDALDHDRFNTIGNAIARAMAGRINHIYLDIFKKDGEEYKFIVVVFRNGAISVRNANINSLTANIRELGTLLDGGYYDEVKEYKKLKGL